MCNTKLQHHIVQKQMSFAEFPKIPQSINAWMTDGSNSKLFSYKRKHGGAQSPLTLAAIREQASEFDFVGLFFALFVVVVGVDLIESKFFSFFFQ